MTTRQRTTESREPVDQDEATSGTRNMPAFRSVVSVLLRGRWETFLYTLQAGPAGGRLRRPSSAGSASTGTGEPAEPSTRRVGKIRGAQTPRPSVPSLRFVYGSP